MNLKFNTHKACQQLLIEKRNQLTNAVADVQKSLGSESKSSAGDKHETGRAMLQLEREKLGQQLQQLQQMEGLLAKIEYTKTQETAVLGSLVVTNVGIYYLGISLGQLNIGDETIFAISLQSPIGKQLFGKRENDFFSFNGKHIEVLKVV